MLRVTRTFRGDRKTDARAPEKIEDAVEDFVSRVDEALRADGVDGIALDEKIGWFAAMLNHTTAAFNDGIVTEFENRVDEYLSVADIFKRGPARGGAQ